MLPRLSEFVSANDATFMHFSHTSTHLEILIVLCYGSIKPKHIHTVNQLITETQRERTRILCGSSNRVQARRGSRFYYRGVHYKAHNLTLSSSESLHLLLLLLNRDKPQLKDTTTFHNKDSASIRLQAAVQTENETTKNAGEKTELGIGLCQNY